MLNRRKFLLNLPALAALPHTALQAQDFTQRFRRKPPAPPPPGFVYFGTDTAKGAAKGIYRAKFDSATGSLTAPVLAAETPRPTYLALSAPVAGHRRLYTANEVEDESATLTSFVMDPATGALRQINRVTSAGAGPCYVSLDATGNAAFVANYAGSTIATYRIRADGSLSEPVERINFKDARFGRRGPVAARQDVPHPHSVHLSPDNRFLLVSDLGSDAISVFAVNPATARLGTPSVFHSERPGCGPRHIAFHPNGRWIYSINELDSTIDQFLWTTTSSRTDPQGILVKTGRFIKTIAPGFPAAKNTAAEVAISLDGNYLYASNRGENTLVVFSIDDDGVLKLLQRIPCGGKTPRHFTLSPDQRWLLCGNQDSATVTIFRRNGGSGRLSGPVQSIPLDSVMFTLFA
ncbi:MAG TPA: lactonase family protein [Acidobacteriaceae bacterium]|nr:lactonase family protein [Acidobacteriaceae bacterium]